MAYRVIKYFTDLQDGEHPYNVGDDFPRVGADARPARIAELSGAMNRQGVPLIEEVPDAEPAAPVKRKKTEQEEKC